MYEITINQINEGTYFSIKLSSKTLIQNEIQVLLFVDDEIKKIEAMFETKNNRVYASVKAPDMLEEKKSSVVRFFLVSKYSDSRVLIGEVIHNESGWKINDLVIAYPSRMVGFALTNQCNLHCNMCWQNERHKVINLDVDIIQKAVNEISQVGMPPIYLWGGEPLLHPQIWDIVREIKKKNLFVIINTNGVLIEKYATEIIESNLDMLIVSLDGTEEIHDKIRGKVGTYKRIIKGLEILLNNRKLRKPRIVINCVITEMNYQMLEELIDLKERLGIDYLEFQLLIFYTGKEITQYKQDFYNRFGYEPMSADSFNDNYGNIHLSCLEKTIENIALKNDETIRVFPYLIKSKEQIERYFHMPYQLPVTKCANISRACWVDSNGDVLPCSNFTDYKLGNIKNDRLLDIWNSTKAQTFRKSMNNNLFSICYRCCDLYKTDLFQRS